METIRNYVDALFASLPYSEENECMKQEMLGNLEEKFLSMQKEGLLEGEAVGRVIASIGSLAELRKEMGIEDNEIQTNVQTQSLVSEATMQEYRAYKSSQMKTIAVAVMCFILAPAIQVLLKTFFIETISNMGFFLLIAVGVALCIYSARHNNYYEKLLNLEKGDKKTQSKRGRRAGVFARIAFPVAACIYLFLGMVLHLWHPGWIIFVVCGVFSSIIAVIEEYSITQQ